MKTPSRVLLPIVLALGAGAALAQGPLQGNEVFESNAPLSRAQVRAEAAEAQRLGLLPQGEVMRVATAEQAEQIRQAGLRAVHGSTVVNSGSGVNAH